MTSNAAPHGGSSSALLPHWQTWLFLLFTYMQMVLAIPLVNDMVALSTDGSTSSTLAAQSVVIAVIMILTGLLFCFFGYRWFRVALWLAGFYVFGNNSFSTLCFNLLRILIKRVHSGDCLLCLNQYVR